MPLKANCPSYKELKIEGTITGRIEVVNKGFERLDMYYCPPFDGGSRSSEGYGIGMKIQGTNKRTQRVRWSRTHTSSSSKFPASGYSPPFPTAGTVSSNGTTYTISDWNLQSQAWTNNSEPGEDLNNYWDDVSGNLVSDDGSQNFITITNPATCPGFIAIHATTGDALWQVGGGIFYELNLTIHEIDDKH